MAYNPNDHIYDASDQGSLHVIADAYYLGKHEVKVKAKDEEGKEKVIIRNYYRLAVLFYRNRKEDAGWLARVRILTLSTSKESSEFNRFHAALYGKPIVAERGKLWVDFDTLGPALVKDLKSNTYNVRVAWADNGHYSSIRRMSKLRRILEHKTEGMVWPKYILNKYPQIAGEAPSQEPEEVIIEDGEDGEFGPGESLRIAEGGA